MFLIFASMDGTERYNGRGGSKGEPGRVDDGEAVVRWTSFCSREVESLLLCNHLLKDVFNLHCIS
jgi:hypothetical protein